MLNIELVTCSKEVINLSFAETDPLYDLVMCASLIKWSDRYFYSTGAGVIGTVYTEIDYCVDIGNKE